MTQSYLLLPIASAKQDAGTWKLEVMKDGLRRDPVIIMNVFF